MDINKNSFRSLEKNVEQACRDYCNIVDKLDSKLRKSTMHPFWWCDSIHQDSAIGPFARYLRAQGIMSQPTVRGKHAGPFTRAKHIFRSQCKLFFDLLGKNVTARNEKSRRQSLIVPLVYLPSSKRSPEAASDDFYKKRKEFFSEYIKSKYNISVIVIGGTPVSLTELNNAARFLKNKYSINAEVVHPRQMRFFIRFIHLAHAIVGFLRVCLVLAIGESKIAKKSEIESIVRPVVSLSPLGFWYYVLIEKLLQRSIPQESILITSYSFRRIERVVAAIVQNKNGTVIDYAPRIYSRQRPSNWITLNDRLLDAGLPDVYLVSCRSSAIALRNQGLDESKIVVKCNSINKINQFQYDVSVKSKGDGFGVILYLQRMCDSPIELINFICAEVGLLGGTVFAQAHPRFSDVREVALSMSKSLTNLKIVDSIDCIDIPIRLAVTVFSSAIYDACWRGISCLWLPFYSFDSVFTCNAMEEIGDIAFDVDDAVKKIKTTLLRGASNKSCLKKVSFDDIIDDHVYPEIISILRG